MNRRRIFATIETSNEQYVFSITALESDRVDWLQMKTTKQIISVVAGMCLALFCSGCAFTQATTQIGERHEVLQIHQILVATNGVVAIDCTASYYSSKSIGVDNGWASRIDFSTEKYLIGTPEAVNWMVTNAKPDPLEFRSRKRHSPDGDTAKTDMLATNHVWVGDLIYDTTNATSWQLVPSSYGGRAATPRDLPQEFGGVVFKYNDVPYRGSAFPFGATFPYKINGQDFQVRVRDTIGNRTYRKWWGYPAQILILPAIAIDVVTLPYQIYVVWDGLNHI